MMNRRWAGARCARLLLGALLCATTSAVRASTGAELRLVVPYVPGAMGDTLARLLAPRLAQGLGQPVIVDNRSGASGNIGTGTVARLKGDDNTLLVVPTNNLVINQFLYPALGFDPLKAFQPVALLADVPMAVFVQTQTPVESWAGFLDHARSHKGKLSYATPGAGTTVHLFSEMLSRRYGLEMLHVPYKGAAQALSALIGGEVDMLVIGAGVGVPYVKEGRLRMLAVSSAQRLPAQPAVPTFAEVGIKDMAADNWWALVAPAGVPASRIERIRREVERVLAQPEVLQQLQTLGVVHPGQTPQEMAARWRAEAAQWQQVVRETGIKAD